jgi:hypothetical protein
LKEVFHHSQSKMLTAEIAGTFLVFGLSLFLAAGTLIWPAGWVFLVLVFGFTIAQSRWLLRHNPGLLTERMTGIVKPGQPSWDRVFFVVLQACFFAWMILMPLDAVRFHWSQMPGWLQVVGAGVKRRAHWYFHEESFDRPDPFFEL